MNAQSDDIPMSHVGDPQHPDNADDVDSQTETLGSATVQNHDDAKTGPTALEKLFDKLNSATIPNHMNTGLSLRWANRYQLEQSGPFEDDHQTARDTENEETLEVDSSQRDTGKGETPEVDSSQRTQNNETDESSPSSAQVGAPQSVQQLRAASNTQPGIPKTIPNPYCSGIHYRRILVCVSVFSLGYQVLFALALGGVFGEWGYLLASIFLIILLVVSLVVVIDGVRQRMWEIKKETTKT